MFDLAWLDQSSDERILATPFWREHITRLALSAYQRADTNHDFVKQAFHRLMTKVPREDGPLALAVLRRVVRVMSAFSSLPERDREILEGRLPHNDTWRMTGNEIVALRLKRQAEVWASDPDLAELRAELDADAAAVSASQERDRLANQAALQDAAAARAKAPGIVLELHEKGVRLDVTDGGRAIAFPASSLTAEDADFLATNNAAMAAAILSAWTA